MKKNLLILAALGISSASFAQVLVDTGFESNTLGALNAQASSGSANPWSAGTGVNVVNTGATLGAQSVSFTSASLAAGAGTYHSWVDLYTTPATGLNLAAGLQVVANVSVFIDSADTNSFAGFGTWANEGFNVNGILAVGANGGIIYRNGVDTVPPLITTNANVVSGWNNLEMRVTQTSASILTTTYKVNGVDLAGISHVRTIAAGNNLSDIDLANYNGGTAAAVTTARFDNYKVAVVPEPATMAALGLGVAAMLRRRKKSA